MAKSLRSVLMLTGRVINEALSLVVFSFLDLFDLILCLVYRTADFFIEAEWKPCYCSSSKEAITSCGKILVSEQGESKIVCLSSSKLQLEEISDTLYSRPSLLSDVSKQTVNEIKRLKMDSINGNNSTTSVVEKASSNKKGKVRSKTFTVNSTIVEMLQGKIGGQNSHIPIPRWSDCDCNLCTCWTSSSKETLFVKSQMPRGKKKIGKYTLT